MISDIVRKWGASVTKCVECTSLKCGVKKGALRSCINCKIPTELRVSNYESLRIDIFVIENTREKIITRAETDA